MEFTINLADELDPVAIYAAFVSTVIAIWEAVKWWRRGPRLRGKALTDIIVVGGDREDPNTYVTFDVANVGTEKTTITNIGLLGFKGLWPWIRKRHTTAAVINQGATAYPIPYVLNVGERFQAMCIQNEKLEHWSRDEWLYGVVWHTFHKRPFLMRIRPIEQTEQPDRK